ncbi:MAG TPA: NADH-quinone oxidoreductase subunit N [Planctomycetota bacterium]|nr:NADH-quinone oxidoreductase subunit N [Planctomycetota bacterium]
MQATPQSFQTAVALIKSDAAAFLPEIALSLSVCALLIYDVVVKKASARGAAILAMIGVAASGLALWFQEPPAGGRELFAVVEGGPGMLRLDRFGTFFKALILAATALTIPMAAQYAPFRRRRMGEFYALLLGSVVGMFGMASSVNLLMFYLSVEFASMASYLLTAFVKRDMKGSEGGLKYVVYGSVASGLMIYGMSLIYGMTGSLHVGALGERLTASGLDEPALVVAGLLAFAGFAYKMSAFPMHFWTPDVYEGAPTPFTAFLSVASKAAGFALFIRFLLAYAPGFGVQAATGAPTNVDWPTLIAIVAAASMTVGNLAALQQTNVKRMLAYSSIAHAGYLLMGVAAMRPGAEFAAGRTDAVLFYFVVYLAMNLGAFFVVNAVESDPRLNAKTVDDYDGLFRRAPFLAICLAWFVYSLIGLPPAAGFTGKLQLFMAVVERDWYWLAIVAGLNTAISMYYYARVFRAMFFGEARDASPVKFGPALHVVVGVLAVAVLWLFVDSDRMVRLTQRFGL